MRRSIAPLVSLSLLTGCTDLSILFPDYDHPPTKSELRQRLTGESNLTVLKPQAQPERYEEKFYFMSNQNSLRNHHYFYQQQPLLEDSFSNQRENSAPVGAAFAYVADRVIDENFEKGDWIYDTKTTVERVVDWADNLLNLDFLGGEVKITGDPLTKEVQIGIYWSGRLGR